MIPGLDRGQWLRPSDKMAIYHEFEDPETWGVRVILLPHGAQVEAVEGERAGHYRAPKRLSAFVRPPGLWERLRGITFEDKVLAEVARKRQVAEENRFRLRVEAP